MRCMELSRKPLDTTCSNSDAALVNKVADSSGLTLISLSPCSYIPMAVAKLVMFICLTAVPTWNKFDLRIVLKPIRIQKTSLLTLTRSDSST